MNPLTFACRIPVFPPTSLLHQSGWGGEGGRRETISTRSQPPTATLLHRFLLPPHSNPLLYIKPSNPA